MINDKPQTLPHEFINPEALRPFSLRTPDVETGGLERHAVGDGPPLLARRSRDHPIVVAAVVALHDAAQRRQQLEQEKHVFLRLRSRTKTRRADPLAPHEAEPGKTMRRENPPSPTSRINAMKAASLKRLTIPTRSHKTDKINIARHQRDGMSKPLGSDRVVRVDERDPFALRSGETVIAGGRHSGILLMDDPEAWIMRGVIVEDRAAVISRAVVDADRLPVGKRLRRDGIEALAQVGRGVVDWNDDGEFRGKIPLLKTPAGEATDADY